MNVWLMTTTFNGDLIAREMLRRNLKISGIIGLEEQTKFLMNNEFKSSKNLAEAFALDYFELGQYGNLSVSELELLARKEIDLLFVCGWQRLIPVDLINLVHLATVGLHGSDKGINHGRGRSPQNWALMLGASSFTLSIFELSTGIDSGRILDTKTFAISPLDDIFSCHIKVSFQAVDMIETFLASPISSLENAVVQKSDGEYFPKRLPSDGLIDWNQPISFLEKFVGALTKPYPGAFTLLDNSILKIWKLREVHKFNRTSAEECAQVIHILDNDKLLVQTSQGICLIDDFDIDNRNLLKVGAHLKGTNFESQTRQIINRHRQNYPNLTVASRIESHFGL